MRLLCLSALLVLCLGLTPSHAADDALHEVNAARAQRGLRPYARHPGLTLAAMRAADFRAARRISGHVSGGMGDFQFLPPGTNAPAAGCGALEPSWGWGSCCTYDNYTYAGAALTMGADGKRYMHLFVSNSPPAATAAPTTIDGTPVVASDAVPIYVTPDYTPAVQPTYQPVHQPVYQGNWQPAGNGGWQPYRPVPQPTGRRGLFSRR